MPPNSADSFGAPNSELLSRALLSGAFDLALALAEAEPEILNARDQAGRHNFLNFFNSGKIHETPAADVARIAARLLDLGADPFATQYQSGGNPATIFSFLSYWRNIGGNRLALADQCCDLWLAAALKHCAGRPELALRALMSRALFDDFAKDAGFGVSELAACCDLSSPKARYAAQTARSRMAKAMGESKYAPLLQAQIDKLDAVCQRHELDAAAGLSRKAGDSRPSL